MSLRPTTARTGGKRPGRGEGDRGGGDGRPLERLKVVPRSRSARDAIRAAADRAARRILVDPDRERLPTEDRLAESAGLLLSRLGLDRRHLAFAMVMLNNALWRERFAAVPFARRLLLLPRCLRNIDGHPSAEPARPWSADIFHVRARAEQLGYTCLVADGTPIVVRMLAERGMDAVLGVACLDSLERAFETVRHLGVPALAVPLNEADCRRTSADLDVLADFLEASGPGSGGECVAGYLPLFREAYGLFRAPVVEEMLGAASPAGAVGCDRLLGDTPRLALDWLLRGGKRLRPFVTLAGYRALLPEADPDEEVRRLAVAIEAFHKASLVHDDIEDDDASRYGLPTLHRQAGVEAAINVGDYLLGMGYRLAAGVREAEASAALVRLLGDAHLRLARGQGAELAWRRGAAGTPSLGDVLRIYALKTAPAFEAALAGGMILARSRNHPPHGRPEEAGPSLARLSRFCRYLGAAFQVLNDLADWESDALHRRPTVLWVLGGRGGLGGLGEAGPVEESAAGAGGGPAPEAVRRAGEFLEERGAFAAARELVERFRRRAVALAEDARPAALADLMLFLTEVVLRERGASRPAGCPA